MPKWVVFDAGGVLVDWHGGLRAVENYFGCSHSEILDKLLAYLNDAEVGKLSMIEVWSRVISNLKLKKDATQAVARWVDGVSVVINSRGLVKDLKQYGYCLAIFSNNWYSVEEVFNKKGLHFFEKYIESWRESLRKPDKKIYRIVEKKLDSFGDDIFFIDDKQINLDTAKGIGWQTFLFDLGEDQGKTACDQIRTLLFK